MQNYENEPSKSAGIDFTKLVSAVLRPPMHTTTISRLAIFILKFSRAKMRAR